jgi:hypothetical protein
VIRNTPLCCRCDRKHKELKAILVVLRGKAIVPTWL